MANETPNTYPIIWQKAVLIIAEKNPTPAQIKQADCALETKAYAIEYTGETDLSNARNVVAMRTLEL